MPSKMDAVSTAVSEAGLWLNWGLRQALCEVGTFWLSTFFAMWP